MGRTTTQRDERNSDIDYLRAPARVKTRTIPQRFPGRRLGELQMSVLQIIGH